MYKFLTCQYIIILFPWLFHVTALIPTAKNAKPALSRGYCQVQKTVMLFVNSNGVIDISGTCKSKSITLFQVKSIAEGCI